MLPLFLYPLGFLGLVAVPALVAIYLLRNRFRRYPVSSLMLWLDAREAREGGTKLRRLQTPLLLLLELLAIVLLSLAAADPQMRLTQGTRPLVVVLDDSFSMLAGGKRSPREQALAALHQELNQHMPYSVRFILAGEKPQVLGEPVRTARRALAIAENWRCKASGARLDEAMALAAELGGEMSLLLVLTDHAPPRDAVPEKGRVRWWSFGQEQPNIAFINAARTGREGRDRCLFEIANLSGEAARTTLVVEPLKGGPPLHRATVAFDAGGAQRIILTLPEGTPAIRARIDDDLMPIDNQVILEPATARPLRVDVRILDRRIREPVEKAVLSSRMATRTTRDPEVVITDAAGDGKPPEGAWVVRFDAEKEATAFSGPFVLDRAHPVTEGLSLKGVIWGAGKSDKVDGAAVVLAGNVPLLTDQETVTPSGSRHELRIRFRPELSTLQESPDWPILIWNILQWRAAALPGLSRTNVRLGEQVVLNLPTYRETMQVTAPGESPRTVPVRGRQFALRAEEVGVHEIRSEGQTFAFAVNALEKDESDLRGGKTGQWGDWLDDTSLRLEYRGVAWLLLLLLLAVAVVHLLVMARPAQGADPK